MERPLSAKAAAEPIDRDELLSWPKTDLHCHLDGSLRLDTLIELAREQHVELPSYDPAELREQLKLGHPSATLQEYLSLFDYTLSVMQGKHALERIAFELAEDSARENVVYLEVRYAPLFHTNRALTWSETVDAVLAGLQRAEARYDITCRLILTGIRSIDPLISKELAELAVAYKGRGVVGFDLAGAEANNPAGDHTEAFYCIKNNNVNCTLHAGEDEGKSSIHEALHFCGADRIGQGTRLIENSDLLNYVNDHRIPLEICLSSAILAGHLDHVSQHPFPFYLDYGIRVTLNTDSRLFVDTTVTDELLLAAETFELTAEDLKNIIINGFKAAFLPYRDKVAMLARYLPRMGRKVPKFQARRFVPTTG